MTAQEPAAQELDPQTILDALGFPDAVVRERVVGGRDTALWRVEREGMAYALRVFRPEQAPVCRREVVVMEEAASAGLPVPRVYAEGVWRDRPALLLEWCSGRTLESEILTRPWRIQTLSREFGRMLARLHAIPAPAALCVPTLDWIEWAGDEESALQERLRATASK